MALVKCEECGHEISDKATACPHCGCPISAAKEKTPKWFENAGKWANQLVVKMKNLPRKAVAICTVLVVLLVVLLCIPKGADKDKSILKEHLLDPASLTIYEAYTNDDYGEGGRATLFYFGAKNKAGGISDDWALVYDDSVQFSSNFDAAEDSEDTQGILDNGDVIFAKFAARKGSEKWKKVM